MNEIRLLLQKNKNNDGSNKTIEAAYRYLVRSYEILETAHGSSHVSVAISCLAAASVRNLARK
jgi:hypothetical protein